MPAAACGVVGVVVLTAVACVRMKIPAPVRRRTFGRIRASNAPIFGAVKIAMCVRGSSVVSTAIVAQNGSVGLNVTNAPIFGVVTTVICARQIFREKTATSVQRIGRVRAAMYALLGLPVKIAINARMPGVALPVTHARQTLPVKTVIAAQMPG